MEKLKVNKEVFEALDEFIAYQGDKLDVKSVLQHHILNGWSKGSLQTLNTLSTKDLIVCLEVGYVLDFTNEELLDLEIRHTQNGTYPYDYKMGYRKAIDDINKYLKINIKY